MSQEGSQSDSQTVKKKQDIESLLQQQPNGREILLWNLWQSFQTEHCAYA